MAIGKRVGNRFANIGSGGNFFGDPKTFESEEARKLASQQGFQRFADALGMAAAYETGDAQRIALAQKQVQQRKIDRENKSLKDVMQSVDRADYLDANTGTYDNKAYYRGMASKLFDKGFTEQGIKLAELGKPETVEGLRKELIGANKTETTTFNATNKGVKNFQQLLDAAKSADGAASYALMIKFIKQLDDSVVREGEVSTFGGFQGVFTNLKNQMSKATGEGFTPEVKANMLNLAAQTANRLVADYDNYKQQKNLFYGSLGMAPELVFSGLDFNLGDLDLTKVYSPEDFANEITGSLE